jgi:hypothetical protein
MLIYGAFSLPTIRELRRARPEQIERIVASKLTASDVVYTDYRTASSLVFFRTGLLVPDTSTTIPYEHVNLLARIIH